MTRVRITWGLVVALWATACSGASSEPNAEQPKASAEQQPVAVDKSTTAGCEPQVTEVLFVPADSGFSVTILGTGFCVGAGIPEAKFGDLQLTNVVVSSSGDGMSGNIERMPASGAVLEVHTPPGKPVVTDYTVP
jgi:hypothetical protein